MEITTRDNLCPSKKCFICEGPIIPNAEASEALQTCDGCKPIHEQYDSVKIFRAYSTSGGNGARIVIFRKQEDEKNEHCLLRMVFQSPEEFAFKSVDEALTAGKVKAKALLGDDARFEEVAIQNPADEKGKIRLLAGIKKISK